MLAATGAERAASYRAFARAHAPEFADVVHIPGCVSDPCALRRLLARAVGYGVRDPEKRFRLRAFRGSTLDYRLHKRLLDEPPEAGQDVSEWVGLKAGAGSGAAVNDLAAWDVELGGWFVERVADLRAAGGLALTAKQDTYAFVTAGSGWTPFGIHKDYEPSLIFHLGPSPKTVWLWEGSARPVGVVDAAPAFGGVSFRLDESLPSARQLTLAAGDFLCIPAHVYHVFRNEGPSSFVGLAVHLPNPRRDAADALDRFAGRLLDGDGDGTSMPASAESLAGLLATHAHELRADAARALAELASAGFVARPDENVLGALEPSDGPFRLAHADAIQPLAETHLCVRGRVVRVRSGVAPARLCSALGATDWIAAPELAATLAVGERSAERMLTGLYRLGGLVQA